MRLVRLLIWMATLFFAAMMFRPLVQEVLRRASEPGGLSLP
jgi:hypothetical protein